MQILVIEDDSFISTYVAHILRNEGYKVSSAATGAVGLRKAKKVNPQAIILDLHLPDRDGFQMCSLLKKQTDARIFIFSADDRMRTVERAIEVGADHFLDKPVSKSFAAEFRTKYEFGAQRRGA